MEVTLRLPDDIFRRVEVLAHRSRREVAEVLSDTIRQSLPAAEETDPTDLPAVAELGDEDVLALAESRMSPGHDERLSLLLDRQGAGRLTTAERYELADLMRVYQEGLLRKAGAVREAVLRGLIEAPTS